MTSRPFSVVCLAPSLNYLLCTSLYVCRSFSLPSFRPPVSVSFSLSLLGVFCSLFKRKDKLPEAIILVCLICARERHKSYHVASFEENEVRRLPRLRSAVGLTPALTRALNFSTSSCVVRIFDFKGGKGDVWCME